MSYIGVQPFGQTVRTVTTITATASQTTFSPNGGYTVGYCDVYYNGIKLVEGQDYNASNGTTVVLTTGATANAVVDIVTYGTVTITDAVRRSGDTFAGAVAINSTLAAGNTTITGSLTASANVNLDSGTLFVDGTNNRVGINNTAPTAPLTVTGNTIITGTANISGATSLSSNVTVSTNTLFVDTTNNRIGINTLSTTSGCPLNVYGGDIRVENASSSVRTRYVAGSNQWNLEASQSSNQFGIYDAAAGLGRMFIDGSGRITMPYQSMFHVRVNNSTWMQTSPIQFSNAPINVGSHFNTSTYRFTAPIAGKYFFIIQVMMRAGNGEYIAWFMRVNGSNRTYSELANSTVKSNCTKHLNAIFELSSGDYVDVIASLAGGEYYGGNQETNFYGWLMG